MKKKFSEIYPAPQLSPLLKKENFSHPAEKRQEITPPPPTEETLQRLNEIVKKSPFCFYYREKENDSL